MHLKLKCALPIALSAFMLVGCTSDESTITINSLDIARTAKAEEQERVLKLKYDRAEELVRHYGYDLYYEDFTIESKEINEKFSIEFEKMFLKEIPEMDFPIKAISNVEVMNDSLMKYRNGQLTFEEIFENLSVHIREIAIRYFIFKDDFTDEEEEELYTFPREMYARLAKKLDSIDYGKPYIEFYFTKSKHQSVISEFEQLSLLELALKLDEEGISADYYLPNGTSPMVPKHVQWLYDHLESKYKKDFLIINEFFNSNRDDTNNGKTICISRDNPEIKFLSSAGRDTYFTTLSQGVIGNEVNRIIEKNGASDRIVQFTYLDKKEDGSEENERIREIEDFDAIFDPDKLIDIYAGGNFEITIFYLAEPGEQVSHEYLEKIIDDVMEKYEFGEEYPFLASYEIHEVDAYWRNIIVDLFEKELYSDMYKREDDEISIESAMANWYENRKESEGFLLLDTLGKRIY